MQVTPINPKRVIKKFPLMAMTSSEFHGAVGGGVEVPAGWTREPSAVTEKLIVMSNIRIRDRTVNDLINVMPIV